jgi:DNA-binding NarL/FixJ family response regulator
VATVKIVRICLRTSKFLFEEVCGPWCELTEVSSSAAKRDDGLDAPRSARQTKPDVVMMNVNMPA